MITNATPGSPDFVPIPEGIAVFDNDSNPGRKIRCPSSWLSSRRVPNEPKLAEDPMVKTAFAGDIGTLLAGKHHDGLLYVIALPHTGMSTIVFTNDVQRWSA